MTNKYSRMSSSHGQRPTLLDDDIIEVVGAGDCGNSCESTCESTCEVTCETTCTDSCSHTQDTITIGAEK
jgi:hypothetical protein